MSKRVFVLFVLLATTFGNLPAGGHGAAPIVHASRSQDVQVEQVQVRGNRRIPESTIRIWLGTREGDPYNPQQLDRDVRALYAQGHFEDVKVYAEDGTRGGKIVTFEVKEWPLLLDIQYEGLKSIQQSTLLEKFRERQVGLSKESQYDPVKAMRAAAVIKELLADEGRPEAKVTFETENISQTAVALTFKIDEGPRFRVADIEFEGNEVFSDEKLRDSMKLVKERGLFTTFTSKDVYHKEKLGADLDRLRVLVYADNGYLRARFGQPRTEDIGPVGNWVPFFGQKGQGLKIVIPVDEGRQYTVGEIKVENNTEFTPEEIKSVFNLKPGEVVQAYTGIQKGMENLKKLYGTRGYIQFSAYPDIQFRDDPQDPSKGIADITFVLEEGKQYNLRRLEFIGNTFTRDRVLRREVLLNEGERYNQQLWDLSLLRLNQLGYFEQVKEEDVTVNTNERSGEVDLTVKVQEKGRQQISFTGGVSGIGGSFIGIDYSTNNLLGYGESLSFAIAAGNRQKIVSVGFVEPYLRGRPISLGGSVFYQNYQFFGQGFNTQLSAINLFSQFGNDALFTQKTAGFSINTSAPLSYFARNFRMGRFTRLGLSYSFSTTDIVDPAINRDDTTENDIPITFRQSGVTQSVVTPTISYNTLNSTLDPTSGKALTLGASLAGGILGGKVNTYAPYVEFRYFRPLWAGAEGQATREPGKTRTFGMRLLFSNIGSYGTPFESNSLSFIGGTPLFSRFFLGGEESIRGYNIRSISPTAPVITSITTRNVEAFDLFTGRRLKVRRPENATDNSIAPGALNQFVDTDRVTSQSLTFIGGDSQMLFNFEYRIPIVGPLQFVPFFDIGSSFNLYSYDDQSIISEFTRTDIHAFFGRPLGVVLNPRGEIATQREINKARTPESPGLPPGFKFVRIRGDLQESSRIALSDSDAGIFDNYRYSFGGELRVQVPVINVPFRLIFAWNPNAETNNLFIEEKRAVRFSIGRTF